MKAGNRDACTPTLPAFIASRRVLLEGTRAQDTGSKCNFGPRVPVGAGDEMAHQVKAFAAKPVKPEFNPLS